MTNDTNVFAADYGDARNKFLTACSLKNAELRRFELSEKRLHGQILTTDVALLGAHDAPQILVVISATHGVEGFAGAAAQTDFLRYATPVENNTAVLLIHALNPFGFANLRRANEDNIDLNRNFIDFDAVPVNAAYRQLADALLPASRDDATLARCRQRIDDYRTVQGQQKFEQAVSGGQYEFPDGLFFGGAAPSWSRQTIETIIAEYNIPCFDRVAVIDIHSGLGPYGYGEIISDHIPGSVSARLAKQWYGDSVTEPLSGTSTSVPKQGLLDYAWHRAFEDKGCYVTLEFGTYPVADMFATLQEENYYWQQFQRGEISERQMRLVGSRLQHFFYPGKRDWQEMVLFRSRQVIAQALAGLADT